MCKLFAPPKLKLLLLTLVLVSTVSVGSCGFSIEETPFQEVAAALRAKAFKALPIYKKLEALLDYAVHPRWFGKPPSATRLEYAEVILVLLADLEPYRGKCKQVDHLPLILQQRIEMVQEQGGDGLNTLRYFTHSDYNAFLQMDKPFRLGKAHETALKALNGTEHGAIADEILRLALPAEVTP